MGKKEEVVEKIIILMQEIFIKILGAIARLGRRAETGLVDEILHHHGFRPARKMYWPDKSVSLAYDRVGRLLQHLFHKNLWTRPRIGRDGFDFVHLGVDEAQVWTVLEEPESEGDLKLDRIPLSGLDGALSRLGSSHSYFKRHIH